MNLALFLLERPNIHGRKERLKDDDPFYPCALGRADFPLSGAHNAPVLSVTEADRHGTTVYMLAGPLVIFYSAASLLSPTRLLSRPEPPRPLLTWQ